MRSWIDRTDLPIPCINLLIIASMLSEIIDKSQYMFNPKYVTMKLFDYRKEMKRICHASIPMSNTTFYWSESLLYIHINGQWFRQPRSVLLMYHNKICDLISVLLYASYSEDVDQPIGSFDATITFILEMAKLLIKYKNDAFHIFKVLEGLVTAETLITIEKWPNTEFLNNLITDLHKKTSFDYDKSSLKQIIIEADVPFRHNLGCLSKILGHPLVSMCMGSESLHKKVTHKIDTTLSKVQDCVNYAKRDYIKKHVQKYKKWPPAEMLPPEAPKALVLSQIYGKYPDCKWITEKYGRTDILHYEQVQLLQNLEFNELENILPYLKDKTVSLLRSQVIGQYFQGIKPENYWESTRLLLTYLLHPSMVHNHVDFLRKYTYSRDFREYTYSRY